MLRVIIYFGIAGGVIVALIAALYLSAALGIFLGILIATYPSLWWIFPATAALGVLIIIKLFFWRL